MYGKINHGKSSSKGSAVSKSIRQIAKESGVDHSAISKVINGKYKADPKKIFEKIIRAIGGVNIQAEKYDDILEMLNSARFPAKFGKAQRTAAWLYNLIETDQRNANKNEEQK